jgi:Zn finger protein HypA/HybF involved in hydrogenase expression
MHELALMQAALETAAAVANDAGATRIEQITFIARRGGHVRRASIDTLFASLGRGTIAEHAKLRVRWGGGDTPDLALESIDVS